jgi:Protein of unknown function (DUF3800)
VQKPYETVRAKSQIGKCAGSVRLGEGELLIALRAYLDSSGKLDSDSITLAALAANDDMWNEFETEWAKILDQHSPKGKYVHMREIYRLIKGFDASLGWDRTNAFGLANECLMYMSRLDKKRFRLFYCTLDLKAWHKLRAETYQLPEPVDMCNRFCSESVIGWYLHYYPEVINPETDTLKYFFDRDEYFKAPFEAKWNAEKTRAEETGGWTPWKVIDEVAAVDMKHTAGIQAADIIAWGMNRETFAQEGEAAKHMGHIIRGVIPSFHIIWDEAKLRKEFKPLLYI